MTVEFEGETYYDDRMFIFYICKVRSEIVSNQRRTTIYHQEAPDDHVWAVVYYRNCARMMPWKIDYLRTREEAEQHYRDLAPGVPRVSLGGESPSWLITYEEYAAWLVENGLSEYDYRKFYPGGGSNLKEVVYEPI